MSKIDSEITKLRELDRANGSLEHRLTKVNSMLAQLLRSQARVAKGDAGLAGSPDLASATYTVSGPHEQVLGVDLLLRWMNSVNASKATGFCDFMIDGDGEARVAVERHGADLVEDSLRDSEWLWCDAEQPSVLQARIQMPDEEIIEVTT